MSKFVAKPLHSISVPHYKNTMDSGTEIMPVPEKVLLPMIQHMGAPCEPVVKVGDLVKVGQLIGDTDAFMSAPIYSSVSGKVTSISEFINPMGMRTPAIAIESDGEQAISEDVRPPEVHSKEDFLKAVRKSGLVGLGGAGFPTHVKLNPKDPDKVDTLIVNAAECEPFITADYREMMENPDDIMDGIKLVMHYLNIKKCIIGIENNKPRAIKLLSKMAEKERGIEVMTLKSVYPQGAEKVLIYNSTKRVVGEGMIPADVGVIPMNVSSVAFVARYIKTGMPLISRRLTVDGSAVQTPKNVMVPLGASFQSVIDFCGGFKAEPKEVFMGGPMMGIDVFNLEYPVIKNNNAIIAFDERQAVHAKESNCIRCGRCVAACPFNLMPAAIEKAYHLKQVDALKGPLKVMLCMECGCCSYVCPAKRQLVATNKLAKNLVRKATTKK
ncbi:electron transport complex subunit RsxC [Zongyangia hominis]|uniref:electron transport complex subunit RsxC n=1 Tax=Zongyangia hominis TaxID=2763677 RepID=UPI0021CC8B64|nr:electron transport complex subunit RsxC [Zongyangia hominis]